jgi:hypothetical protein
VVLVPVPLTVPAPAGLVRPVSEPLEEEVAPVPELSVPSVPSLGLVEPSPVESSVTGLVQSLVPELGEAAVVPWVSLSLGSSVEVLAVCDPVDCPQIPPAEPTVLDVFDTLCPPVPVLEADGLAPPVARSFFFTVAVPTVVPAAACLTGGGLATAPIPINAALPGWLAACPAMLC